MASARRRSVFDVVPWPVWPLIAVVGGVLLTDAGRKLVGIPLRGEAGVDHGCNGNPRSPPPALAMPSKSGQEVRDVAELIAFAVKSYKDVASSELYPIGVIQTAAVLEKRKVTFEDLVRQPRVSFATAMQDPSAARGKFLCIRGRVVDLDQPLSGMAEGAIENSSHETVRFVAITKIRTAVGLEASFCGAFVGRYTYDNKGKTVDTALTVGIIHLAEDP